MKKNKRRKSQSEKYNIIKELVINNTEVQIVMMKMKEKILYH